MAGLFEAGLTLIHRDSAALETLTVLALVNKGLCLPGTITSGLNLEIAWKQKVIYYSTVHKDDIGDTGVQKNE